MALGALLSGAASSRQTQLATTAVVSAAVAAAAILSYQRLAQDRRVARLKRSIPPDGEEVRFSLSRARRSSCRVFS